MNWLIKARSLNGIAAVVAVLAWLAGTNHCLLGLRHQHKSAVSTCTCPNHSEKSDGAARGSSAMLGCCQGLQSAKIDLAKAKIEPVLVGRHLLPTAHFTLPEVPRNIIRNTIPALQCRVFSSKQFSSVLSERTVLQAYLREGFLLALQS